MDVCFVSNCYLSIGKCCDENWKTHWTARTLLRRRGRDIKRDTCWKNFEQISPENMKYRKQTHSFDLSCYVEDDTRKLLQRVNKNFGNVNAQRHPNKWISNGFINVDPVEICQSQSIRAYERVGKKIDTQNWKRFSTVKLFAEQRVVYDSIFFVVASANMLPMGETAAATVATWKNVLQ